MVALLAFTLFVGAVTFVLSFYGLRDYGWRVAGVPRPVAWLVPVGVDLLSLVGVAATFALRHAPWKPRSYAWTVFGVAVAASMGGNLSHAQAHHLTWQGRVGATAWPVFLALSAHMVIVVWRHMEKPVRAGGTRSATWTPNSAPAVESRRVATATAAPATTATAALPAAAATPSSDTTPVVSLAGRDRRRDTRPAAAGDLRQRARDMYRDDPSLSCGAIARELKTIPRNVERWTKDMRQARDTATAASDDDLSDRALEG
jgi:hypothetical protein